MGASFGGRLLASSLGAIEGIWVGASWDDHRCVSVSLLNALIVHDILGEVLSTDHKTTG